MQSIADLTPETGAAIIESAGLSVRKANPRGRRTFAVKQGAVSGAAVVTAATAGARSSYEWQYSVDGGKTWVDAPATTQMPPCPLLVVIVQPARRVALRARRR
ncbi:MAG TPA: hypothetical protein VIY73_07865 [Polyangiaceae bacterium]